MEPGRLTVRLDQKAVTGGDGPGEISGLASVYGNIDLQDDVMESGALNKSAADFRPGTSKIPLLDWHGDSLSRLIGSVRDLKSTPAGLWFRAGFSSAPEAQSARQKAMEGHLSGVSIGYLPVRDSRKWIGDKAVRVLHEVKLLEISLTPVPANPMAQVASVKAGMSSAAINDLPDSAFAYIEPGGSKDAEGKTVPRSLRHFPIHDKAHVQNALSRAPQSPFGDKAMPKIRAAAKKFGVHMSAALDYGQFADAMRHALGIGFEPAAKAAVDALLGSYTPELDAAGPADGQEPTAGAAAPEGGTAGKSDDAASYALSVIAKHSGPRDGAPGGEPPDGALAGPLAALEVEREAKEMDRLEADIKSALGGDAA